MIQESTVLILGAGASFDCGYPLAGQLRELILDSERIESHLKLMGQSSSFIRHFRNQFEDSRWASIDGFLSHREEFIEIGKYAIASAITLAENRDLTIGKRRWLWYDELFKALATTGKDIHRSQLTIVTFNYDCSLEYYLWNSLQARFGITAEEARHILGRMNIIHIYGDVGPLSELKGADGTRSYGSVRCLAEGDIPYILRECASQIKVLHEGKRADVRLVAARDVICRADKVCFLGFGFHEENMERLLGGLSTLPDIWACATGLEEGDKDRTARKFFRKVAHKQIVWGERSHDARQFLCANDIFI